MQEAKLLATNALVAHDQLQQQNNPAVRQINFSTPSPPRRNGCKYCNAIILKLPLLFIKCILIWIFQQIVIVVRSANDESAMSSTAGAIAGPSRRRSDHEDEEEDIVKTMIRR